MKKIEFLTGSLLLGAGIGICNQTAWGMDPFDVMTTGIADGTGISLSVVNLAIYLGMCAGAFCMDKKQLSLWTCTAPFVTSWGIEMILRGCPVMEADVTAFFIYLIGMTVIALGTAVAIDAGIGKSPYDAFIYGIMTRTGRGYAQVRWGVDGFCLLAGIMLGGSWGAGTIVSLLAVGKLMETFQTLFDVLRLRAERR